MRLIKETDWRVTPWRSGQGETAEIASFPAGSGLEADDFIWRLSVARMTEDADFSAFPGFDRILTVIAGAGLELDATDEGACETALPVMPIAFPGERRLRGHLMAGPVRNLNLIYARGQARGAVRLQDFAAGASTLSGTAMALAIFSITGPPIRVRDGTGGEPFDLNAMEVLLQCDEGNTGFDLSFECRDSCRLILVEVLALGSGEDGEGQIAPGHC